MNIQFLDTTNDNSQSIWNNAADQLLATQKPLNLALAEQVFPASSPAVQSSVLITAVERLRAAHRQIMQALDGIPSVKADLLKEAVA